MLVVTLGQIVFTRRVLPTEDFVNVVECWHFGCFLHLSNVDLDLARIGKLDFLDRAKYAVLIYCVNSYGVDPPLFSFYPKEPGSLLLQHSLPMLFESFGFGRAPNFRFQYVNWISHGPSGSE